MINATGNITLERATAEQVRARFGTGGDYVKLTIDGDGTWFLPADELPGGIHQAHEIQRRRMDALAHHEPWCDQPAHIMNASGVLDPSPDCVGRGHVITLGGQEYGSYWQQEPGREEPVLFIEWPGLHMSNLSPADVRAWLGVLRHFTPSPEVDQISALFTAALDELDGDRQ